MTPLDIAVKALNDICIASPHIVAKDIARQALSDIAAIEQQGGDEAEIALEGQAAENQRLHDALCFWLPSVPANPGPMRDRIVQDAYLLVGYDNAPDEQSAEQLGWITTTQGVDSEIVAYASSQPHKFNHLISKAQYDSALPKNRVDYDMPLGLIGSKAAITWPDGKTWTSGRLFLAYCEATEQLKQADACIKRYQGVIAKHQDTSQPPSSAQAVRDQALEDAAKACKQRSNNALALSKEDQDSPSNPFLRHHAMEADDCAYQILSLKSQPAPQGGKP